MICPVCKNQVNEGSRFCPFCQTRFAFRETINTQIPVQVEYSDIQKNSKKSWDKGTIFCLIVIVLGSILLLILIFSLFSKKEGREDEKTTTTTTEVQITQPSSLNKGVLSSFRYPLSVSNIGLATFVDKQNNKETDVDVYGIRFLNEEEKNSLIVNAKEPLREGFIWEAFVYEVRFRDLDYLNNQAILPSLDTKVYLTTGCDFVVIGEHNILLNTQVFGGTEPIYNHGSSTMQVLYQIPENTVHSICIGNENKKMACFTK